MVPTGWSRSFPSLASTGRTWLRRGAAFASTTYSAEQTASIFHVEDARSSIDVAGRKTIPAQDFVERYSVRTVYGMRGCWPGQHVRDLHGLTRELFPTVRLAPILSVFGSVGSPLVARGRYFAS